MAALPLVEAFTTVANTVTAVIDAGAVEACVGCMRANALNSEVNLASASVLLRVCNEGEDATMTVSKKGGTRAIINCLSKLTGENNMQVAACRILEVTERICAYPDGQQQLVKQGALKGVVNAMDKYGDSEEIAERGGALLALLQEAEGVEKTVERLCAIAADISNAKPEEVARVCRMIGHLAAASEENLTIINAHGGTVALVSILSAASEFADGPVKVRALHNNSIFSVWREIIYTEK